MQAAPCPLLLLLGPSGVGKSATGNALAQTAEFLHLEFDQWQQDGVTNSGLRSEWDSFYERHQPEPLAGELNRRAIGARKKGVVVSLPSLVVLPEALLERAKRSGISTSVLYGSESECLNSFLRREAQSGRNLPAEHWLSNNAHSYTAHGRPEYAPYRLTVFASGTHRPMTELMKLLLQRNDG